MITVVCDRCRAWVEVPDAECEDIDTLWAYIFDQGWWSHSQLNADSILPTASLTLWGARR